MEKQLLERKKNKVLLLKILTKSAAQFYRITSLQNQETLVDLASDFIENYKILKDEFSSNLSKLIQNDFICRESLSFNLNYIYRFAIVAEILEKSSSNLKTNITKIDKEGTQKNIDKLKEFINLCKKVKKELLVDIAQFEKKLKEQETFFTDKLNDIKVDGYDFKSQFPIEIFDIPENQLESGKSEIQSLLKNNKVILFNKIFCNNFINFHGKNFFCHKNFFRKKNFFHLII